VENAVLDYYRAFEQRSRWVREELLIDEELEGYERRLVDEWERIRLALQDEVDIPNLTEYELRHLGRKLLNWVEQVADIRIRKEVTVPYVMRGSYHILADGEPPQIWWHPQFLERLEGLLLAESEE
jgi:hypothetical protein